MSQELTRPSAIAPNLIQNNYGFFSALHNCQFIDNSLASLKVKQATATGDAYIYPSKEYINQLKTALKFAASPYTLSCVLPKIHFAILPETAMQHFVGMQEMSGGYAFDYTSILLNEHLFKPCKKAQQQLIGILRNELSHAAVHLTLRETYGDARGGYDAVKPWSSDTQKQQLITAYAQFEANVARYEKLSNTSHKHLSSAERIELIHYRRAIDSFKPKQLGPKGHTVMQGFIVENPQTKGIELHKDLQSKPPARGKIKQRRRYMETAFFRERSQLTLHGRTKDGPYASLKNSALNDYRLWADKISDFDQLSPAMQRLLGPKLCEYLRDFHQTPSHCDYAFGN